MPAITDIKEFDFEKENLPSVNQTP